MPDVGMRDLCDLDGAGRLMIAAMAEAKMNGSAIGAGRSFMWGLFQSWESREVAVCAKCDGGSRWK